MSSKISTHSVVEYLKVRNSAVSNAGQPINSGNLSALLEQTDKLFMSRVSESLQDVKPVEQVEQAEPVEQVKHVNEVNQAEPVDQLEELTEVCAMQAVEQTKHEVTDKLVTFAEELVQELACQISDVLPSQ